MDRRKFIHKTVLGTAVAAAAAQVNFVNGNSSSVNEFTLPPLGYSFDALEPSIDKQTMEIHYSKHHEAYIKNLNKEIAANPGLANKSLDDLLKDAGKYSNIVRNNAGGHYNHSMFWKILSPAQGAPSVPLKDQLVKDFSSFEKFKELFEESAKTRFGSGWAWLVASEGKLKISSTPNQDNPLMNVADVKGFPVFGLDVWEHAYYLKYQNRRPEYIAAFWNVINWNEVNKRFSSHKF